MRFQPHSEQLEHRLLLHGDAINPFDIDPQSEYFALNHERVFNFARQPDTYTVADGSWSDASTWANQRMPSAGDRIQINHSVSVDGQMDAAFDAINVNPHAELSFAPDRNTRLQVGTLTILWGGALTIGTEHQPIASQSLAEIIFSDQPLDVTVDPAQHGIGLLVLGGRLETHGRDTGSGFVQVQNDIASGEQQLTLSAPVPGWMTGDQIFIPDTRVGGESEFNQAEFATIQQIAADGRTVVLDAQLQYDHVGVGGHRFHAANLGGNIIFRSENPAGIRGHVLITERSTIDVHDAVFRDLGRTTVEQLDNTQFTSDHDVLHVGTNQVGRYSMHLHHMYGPEESQSPYQYDFSDNVIMGGTKWGLAIHDTHYGLVDGNVIVDVQGAGIVFEDGSETGNLVTNNFTGLHRGSGDGDTSRNGGNDPVDIGDGTAANPFRTLGDQAHAGIGIWARGSLNAISNNVMVDANHAGLLIWSRGTNTRMIPAFRGADPRAHGLISTVKAQSPLDIGGNTTYATENGFMLGGVGQGSSDYYRIHDLLAWNVREGIDVIYSGDLLVEDTELVGYKGGWAGLKLAVFIRSFTANRLDVRGFRVGVGFAGVMSITDSHFDNTVINIQSDFMRPGNASIGYEGTGTEPVLIDNVTFGDMAQFNIKVDFPVNPTVRRESVTIQRDMFVYDYNGVAGDDFQLFMPEQAEDFVMLYSGMGGSIVGDTRYSPVRNATNRELWDDYRISAGGRLLPSDASARDRIDGLVAQIPNDITAPAIDNVTVEIISPSEAIVHWTTDEPATSQVEWTEGALKIGEYGNLTVVDDVYKTVHAVKLSNLTPGVDYFFEVYSHDNAGNAGGYLREYANGAYLFSRYFRQDAMAVPSITLEGVIDITTTTAVARFATNLPSKGQAIVTDSAGNTITFNSSELASTHHIELSGLRPGERYTVQFIALGVDGTRLTAARRSLDFTTNAWKMGIEGLATAESLRAGEA